MRPIDADKLIQFVDYSAGLGGLWGRLLTAFKTVIKEVVNIQPTIGPELHWIPCSERLPEEDGLYLVTTSKGQVQVHAFNHNGNSEEYWMRCNKAWMPLPEPYKEGDAE